MTNSKEEYLKLLKELADNQYSSEELETAKVEGAWIWAEPPAKEKMKKYQFNYEVDATDWKKEQISKALNAGQNLRVGNFLLKFSSYYGDAPLDKKTLSFSIYEKKFRTPNGQPCNMDFQADLINDTRFNERPWLSYFGRGSWAREVPINTILDIVKWMQIIKKLPAFI